MGASKKYNKDFFKTWSREMAYILGFMYADGNVVVTKRGNYYIAIYTSDEELLGLMRDLMESEHKISKRNSHSGSVYRIQVGSKEWFDDLGEVGLTPNKSLRMQLPIIPPPYFGDFIRGYFDGDGNVWTGTIHKERRTTHVTLRVSFTSGSVQFLKALHSVLRKSHIEGGSVYTSKIRNFSRLTFSERDALKLYKIMYNIPHRLYLKRKKDVFDAFVEICGRGVAG